MHVKACFAFLPAPAPAAAGVAAQLSSVPQPGNGRHSPDGLETGWQGLVQERTLVCTLNYLSPEWTQNCISSFKEREMFAQDLSQR
jgi:hypothetical protein